MFKTPAKSGLVDLLFAGLRPRLIGFSSDSHSNDNLPGFRRPKGRRRIPTPALVCHWIVRNGRLECRWQVQSDAPVADVEPARQATRAGDAIGPRRISHNRLRTVLLRDAMVGAVRGTVG